MNLRRSLWPFRTGLTRRLAVINIVALLPLALLTVMLTRWLLFAIDENQTQAALGLTIRAAEPETRQIGAARTLARTLAAIAPALLNDSKACTELMDVAAASDPTYSLIGYLRADGQMLCASMGRQHDFAGSPLFDRLTSGQGTQIALSLRGPVSGVPVLSVSHPVVSATGENLGLIMVSVPQHVLRADPNQSLNALPAHPDALLTFDHEGGLLTSSLPVTEASAMLPVEYTLVEIAGLGTTSFLGHDRVGRQHSYAVVSLTPELFLLGIWDPNLRPILSGLRAMPYLIVALMLFSGFVAAMLAADRLVIRHIRSLASAMTDFAGGARVKIRRTLHDPPAEIAALAEAYDSLTHTILREEAERDNLLREKQHLLREVHHRTGNSMQLIASILRMHSRETTDPGVRDVLDELYGRVMILSTVHLGLYRTAGFTSLDMQGLITNVISRIDNIHGRRGDGLQVMTEVEPLMLSPQQAVPLALLLSEVLPAYLGAPGNHNVPVTVRLASEDGANVRFSVNGPPGAGGRLSGLDGDTPALIGARLLRSFVRQLDGDLELVTEADGSLTFTMRFLVRHNQP